MYSLIIWFLVSLLLLATTTTTTQGFVATTTTAPTRKLPTQPRRSGQNGIGQTHPTHDVVSLKMLTFDSYQDDDNHDPTTMTTTTGFLLQPLLLVLGALCSTTFDPFLEVQILTGISHVGLDLAAMVASAPKTVIRLAALIGRLCTIFADYLPDHQVYPEEFLFQTVMLLLSAMSLVRALLLPIFASTVKTLSGRDGRVFRAIFGPAGVSFRHYKAMAAVGAVEWVTVSQREVIDNNHVYWLYAGQVEVVDNNNTVLQRLSRKAGAAPSRNDGRLLIGQDRLVDLCIKGKTGGSTETTATTTATTVTSPQATLLRLHVPKLQCLLALDQELAEAVRTMLFQGMQAKVTW